MVSIVHILATLTSKELSQYIISRDDLSKSTSGEDVDFLLKWSQLRSNRVNRRINCILRYALKE